MNEFESLLKRQGAVPPTDLQLSVVIPMNNEKENVRPLLDELRDALRDVGRYELIIVDDGSTDGTGEEVRLIGCEEDSLRLLKHATRRGQTTAIYNGVRAAMSDIVVLMDGDLQNDPADVAILLKRFRSDPSGDNLGLLVGHRVSRRDSSMRRLASRAANAVRARVLDDGTPDTGCGLKIVKRSAFMQLPYFDHMHRFLPALMMRGGYRVLSVPVRHRPRVHARAHYGIWDRAWMGLIDLIGVVWLIRRSRSLDFEEERM